MANCCPKPTALTAITATTCPEELGQIQRIILVRRGFVKWNTVTPASNLPATITLLVPTAVAGWTILKAAVDNTKVIVPPLFGGDIVVAPGEAGFFGGNDNSTLNGEAYHTGVAPSTFTARYDSLTAAQTLQLKNLICESLEVYFVNQDGDIIGRRNGSNFTGFDAINVLLNTRALNGFNTRDSNNITFQMDKDWDTTFEKITPTDFSALTF